MTTKITTGNANFGGSTDGLVLPKGTNAQRVKKTDVRTK